MRKRWPLVSPAMPPRWPGPWDFSFLCTEKELSRGRSSTGCPVGLGLAGLVWSTDGDSHELNTVTVSSSSRTRGEAIAVLVVPPPASSLLDLSCSGRRSGRRLSPTRVLRGGARALAAGRRIEAPLVPAAVVRTLLVHVTA